MSKRDSPRFKEVEVPTVYKTNERGGGIRVSLIQYWALNTYDSAKGPNIRCGIP
jgi:hypothetical protein